MKTLNLINSFSIDTSKKENMFSFNIKNGDILSGVITNINDNDVEIKFETLNKTVMLKKDEILNKNISENDTITFEIKNLTKDKFELKEITNESDNLLDDNMMLESLKITNEIEAKDVFESHDFIEKENSNSNVNDNNKIKSEEDTSLKSISKNAFEENIKKLMNYENFSIYDISLDEFIKMIIDSNYDMLCGIESGENNLAKSIVKNDISKLEYIKKMPDELVNLSKDVLNKIDEITTLDETKKLDVLMQMLKDEKSLTLNNIYNTKYTISNNVNNKEEINLNNFENDIKSILKNEDIKDTNENIKLAKGLIKNEIDITKANIERFKEIESSINSLDKEEIFKKSLENYLFEDNKTNLKEIDVCLESEEHLKKVSEEIKDTAKTVLDDKNVLNEVSKIKDVSIDDIEKMIEKVKAKHNNKEIENKNVNIDINEAEIKNVNENVNETNISLNKDALALKEMLESVRLEFSAKSAYHMYSKGIDIKLEPLKNVVSEIKNINKKIENIEMGKKLNETYTDLNKLANRNFAMYVDELDYISNTSENENISNFNIKHFAMKNEKLMSIENLLSEVSSLKNDTLDTNNLNNIDTNTLKLIEGAYEENMITSRYNLKGEYRLVSNSIEHIMESLGIEVDELNKKCATILSLSDKEVNAENINKIRTLETKLDYIEKNLTPKVALELINDRVDITRENIDRVIKLMEEKINEIVKNNANDAFINDANITSKDMLYESIADMLVSGKISDEVKDAMLGMYKVMNKISKYGDAGVGILDYHLDESLGGSDINIDINLRDIFDATKVLERQKYGNAISATIDDAFGNLKEVLISDGNAKKMLDDAFNKLKQKIDKQLDETNTIENRMKNAENEYSEVKKVVDSIKENEIILKNITSSLEETTLEDIRNIKDFEDSRKLLKDNLLVSELLKESSEIKEEVMELDNNFREEKVQDEDYKKHIDALKNERKSLTDEILGEYEKSTSHVTESEDTLDITQKIFESNALKLEKIDSINKVLKLATKTNNTMQLPIYINEEITNINLYFNERLESEKDINKTNMVISMSLKNIGDIKVEIELNNANKTMSLDFITNDTLVMKEISKRRSEILNNINSSDCNVSEMKVNGTKIKNENNENTNMYIKNSRLKNINLNIK